MGVAPLFRARSFGARKTNPGTRLSFVRILHGSFGEKAWRGQTLFQNVSAPDREVQGAAIRSGAFG
jgi:hypothetical protein